MQNIVVNEGQTFFDLAVQYAGDVEQAFALSVINNRSITDEIESGEELVISDTVDVEISGYFVAGRWKPANGDAGTAVIPGGIGYMGLGIDFKVS